MFDVITIGGATRDIFFQYDDLLVEKNSKSPTGLYLNIPYGAKKVSKETFYSYGGGAVNTAVCLARLGLKSASVCNIGREGTGSLVMSYLKKEKVNTSLVRRDTTLHTGLSVFILGKDSEHTGFLERGANSHLVIDRISKLKKTRWFYVSSLTGSSAKPLPEIFAFAQRHKIKIAFNPGSTQLAEGYQGLKSYIEQSEVLILNRQEAEGLVFSKTKKNYSSEKQLLSATEKMGAKISVVTEDGKGSYATCEGKDWHVRAFSTKVIDTTGAGDAYGATFVAFIIKGYTVRQAMTAAAVNAASVVSKLGAGDGLLSYNELKGELD